MCKSNLRDDMDEGFLNAFGYVIAVSGIVLIALAIYIIFVK